MHRSGLLYERVHIGMFLLMLHFLCLIFPGVFHSTFLDFIHFKQSQGLYLLCFKYSPQIDSLILCFGFMFWFVFPFWESSGLRVWGKVVYIDCTVTKRPTYSCTCVLFSCALHPHMTIAIQLANVHILTHVKCMHYHYTREIFLFLYN